MTKRKKGEKPTISPEARRRILGFVREIELLEKQYAVHLAVQDDTLAFRDARRSDDWDGYGEWDAQIFDATQAGQLKPRNVIFELFNAWDYGSPVPLPAPSTVELQSIARLQEASGAAVTTLLSIMLDGNVPAGIRLRAIEIVLERAAQTNERDDIEARVADHA